MQENILGNAVNFLWKRNRRGRQGTAFRDAWQTRLFRLGWRLESASITKYVERKTNVYLRSLSGEAPTYLVSTHFCSSVHSFRRLPPATQLQLDRRRWGTMITKFFSLYFPPFLPSLSQLFEGGRCFKGGQQGKYLAALRGCCYFYSGSDVGILWFYLKPKKL